ncbi:hypothetical protein EDC01DRAFT_670026 [Geopyxis carbonaria]|nr:hypothetical protein EDC01DRAFT_670026 [Geopyxis carbonaria]
MLFVLVVNEYLLSAWHLFRRYIVLSFASMSIITLIFYLVQKVFVSSRHTFDPDQDAEKTPHKFKYIPGVATFAIFFAVIGDWAFEDMKNYLALGFQNHEERLNHDIEGMAPAAGLTLPVMVAPPDGQFELQANPIARQEAP